MTHGDSHLLGPDLLPTPFSTDEIRAGCPAGRTTTSRVQTSEGTWLEVSRFDEVDEEGAEIESWTERLDGGREGSQRSRSTWHELQAHAGFPRERTEMDRVVLTTELGEMFCARYRVRGADGTGAVTTFWFDLGRPGMPVAYETADASVTMVADEVSR